MAALRNPKAVTAIHAKVPYRGNLPGASTIS